MNNRNRNNNNNNPFTGLFRSVRNTIDAVVEDLVNVGNEVAQHWGGGPDDGWVEPEQHQHYPFPHFPVQQGSRTIHVPMDEIRKMEAPPASIRAIRQLPTIRVEPEDLVEPSNRECCICFEENCLGHKVTRLPCAHIFHQKCIIDWLANYHCTCPVCRYELPTDNATYEIVRLEKMKLRKPRFAMYELERMSISQLLELLPKDQHHTITEKSDLIQRLISLERIILIPTPAPVSYHLDALQKMKISELRRTMEDAGVFFHSRDVVEKSDMLTIFQNSGRLNLLPPTPEESIDHGDDDDDAMIDHSDEGGKTATPTKVDLEQQVESLTVDNTYSRKRPMVETVNESDDEEKITSANKQSEPSITSPVDMFGLGSFASNHAERQAVAEAAVTTEAPISASASARDISSAQEEQHIINEVEGASNNPMVSSTKSINMPNDADVPKDKPSQSVRSDTPNQKSPLEAPQTETEQEETATRQAVSETHHGNVTMASQGQSKTEPKACPFRDRSIADLQRLAQEANVDLSSCVERKEMIDLLTRSGVTGDHQASDILRGRFLKWSVSQLRALASECEIDLSHCTDRDDMLDVILIQANTVRPHLKRYLRALSPLATASLPELRAIAREWNVDISNCLEKDEIIQCLISRSNTFGFC